MTLLLINFGCGSDFGKSWQNYDASPRIRLRQVPIFGRLTHRFSSQFPAEIKYGDILSGPLCDDSAADAVYASHVLEHLSRTDMRIALRHVTQMLKPGGIFRCIVPDLEWRARSYVQSLESRTAQSADMFIQNLDMGMEPSRRGFKSRIREALSNAQHMWMYDERSLSQELHRAGFTQVRRCEFGDSNFQPFDEVESPVRFTNSRTNEKELAFHCSL